MLNRSGMHVHELGPIPTSFGRLKIRAEESEEIQDSTVLKVHSMVNNGTCRSSLNLLKESGLLTNEFGSEIDLAATSSQFNSSTVQSSSDIFHPSVNQQRKHAKFVIKTFRRVVAPLQRTTKKRWVYKPEKERSILVQDSVASKTSALSAQVTDNSLDNNSTSSARSSSLPVFDRTIPAEVPSFKEALESGILNDFQPADVNLEFSPPALFVDEPSPPTKRNTLLPSSKSRYETLEMKKQRNSVMRLLYCTSHPDLVGSCNNETEIQPKSHIPTSSSKMKSIRSSHEMLQEQSYRLRAVNGDDDCNKNNNEEKPIRYLVDSYIVDRPITGQEIGLPSSKYMTSIPQGFDSGLLACEIVNSNEDNLMMIKPEKKKLEHFSSPTSTPVSPSTHVTRRKSIIDRSHLEASDFSTIPSHTPVFNLASLEDSWNILRISTSRRLKFITKQIEGYSETHNGHDENLLHCLEWRIAGSWQRLLIELRGYAVPLVASSSCFTILNVIESILTYKRCLRPNQKMDTQTVEACNEIEGRLKEVLTATLFVAKIKDDLTSIWNDHAQLSPNSDDLLKSISSRIMSSLKDGEVREALSLFVEK